MSVDKYRFSKGEWRAVEEVASALSHFAEQRMFTYIDRIADAFSPGTAVTALKDALRALRSEQAKNPGVKLPSSWSVETVIRLFAEKTHTKEVLAALALTSWQQKKKGPEGGEEERTSQ